MDEKMDSLSAKSSAHRETAAENGDCGFGQRYANAWVIIHQKLLCRAV